MTERKTTIADIAAAAGVSTATVDRVLNGRPGVSAAVQAKVREVAKRLKADRALDAPPLRWLRLGFLIQPPLSHFYSDLDRLCAELRPRLEAHRLLSSVHYYDSLEPEHVAARIQAVSAEVDALIVLTYSHPLIREALYQCSRRMPVVTLASDIPGCGRVAYVGIDNHAAGRVAAELMGRFLGPRGGKILLLNGLPSFIGHAEREAGFRLVLQQSFPSCRIVAARESGEQPDRVYGLMSEVLDACPDLDGVYNTSVGDDTVAAVLRERGRLGKAVFIGHDLTLSNRNLLLQGAMDAVLDQHMQASLTMAAQHVLAHFQRISIPLVYHPQQVGIVLRENVPYHG
ncbi:LacI family DNA-binding transcriptional regulator [Frateuria defendens]|uniref:LacI family DNA-binding transcriptional regulator n=1 Tax=Frateuria defendens TaxID=2219559 RepID=UPI00066FC1B1|nr:LacI family DNA-binding transcriptional regulator [Frateuria defendens]